MISTFVECKSYDNDEYAIKFEINKEGVLALIIASSGFTPTDEYYDMFVTSASAAFNGFDNFLFLAEFDSDKLNKLSAAINAKEIIYQHN